MEPKEIKTFVYEASDGKCFKTEKACLKYEKRMEARHDFIVKYNTNDVFRRYVQRYAELRGVGEAPVFIGYNNDIGMYEDTPDAEPGLLYDTLIKMKFWPVEIPCIYECYYTFNCGAPIFSDDINIIRDRIWETKYLSPVYDFTKFNSKRDEGKRGHWKTPMPIDWIGVKKD